MALSGLFAKSCTQNLEPHKTFILSTGKNASNQTLSKSLSSLWNCYPNVKNQGLVILLAECLNGIGSESFQQFIDGRLGIEKIKNASHYIDGMENLGIYEVAPEDFALCEYVCTTKINIQEKIRQGLDLIASECM